MTVQFESIQKSEVYDYQVTSAAFRRSFGIYRTFGKRALDLMAVLLILPIVLPVALVVTGILLACGGKPFYRQERVGRDGRIFTIFKFRTMVDYAEDALERHLERNPDARAEWDVHQKLKEDPRITSFGHFLRKTSLDELPQLLNVLRGEMALVGPRPMMPEQQALYPSHAYYRLVPGITGYWQISDRNQCEFRARAMFDSLYEREMSLITDIGVLARTILVVVRGTGY